MRIKWLVAALLLMPFSGSCWICPWDACIRQLLMTKSVYGSKDEMIRELEKNPLLKRHFMSGEEMKELGVEYMNQYRASFGFRRHPALPFSTAQGRIVVNDPDAPDSLGLFLPAADRCARMLWIEFDFSDKDSMELAFQALSDRLRSIADKFIDQTNNGKFEVYGRTHSSLFKNPNAYSIRYIHMFTGESLTTSLDDSRHYWLYDGSCG
jgi:hypothetical protein